MSGATLNHVLEQLDDVKQDELARLRRALDTRLSPKDEEERRRGFARALLESGLVTEIKPPRTTRPSRELVPVQGRPVSESLIEERR